MTSRTNGALLTSLVIIILTSIIGHQNNSVKALGILVKDLLSEALAEDDLHNSGNALILYTKYLATNPTDKKGVEAALDNTARLLYQEGNWSGSIQYENKALSINSTNVGALTWKAMTLGAVHNYIDALKFTDKALSFTPNDHNLLTNKALMLAAIGNETGAITYSHLAIKAGDTDIEYLIALLSHLPKCSSIVSGPVQSNVHQVSIYICGHCKNGTEEWCW